MPQSFAEHLKSFPLSPNLGQSLERAHGFARDQSHKLVTLEHLLLALAEDPEAVIILQAANVDLGKLTAEVSSHLGRLLEDMRADGDVEPRPDPELLRVLQAAASAALQSRRRQIDGAIVLAAVVGDGKSPAAGILKALGMTFEEAIRALQRANTKARLKPQTKPAAPGAAPLPVVEEELPPPRPVPMPKPNGSAKKIEPAVLAAPVTAAQTAEDILAAARERIRQRAAAAKAEREPKPEPPAETAASEPAADPWLAAKAAAKEEPAPAPDAAAQTKTLVGAIEAAMATEPEAEAAPAPAAAAAPAATAPAPAAPAAKAPPNWAPPPKQAILPASQLPAARRAPGPALPRPIQANEGPPRPPLPMRPGQPRPAGKFPPPRAPWPEGNEPRLPMPNGNAGGAYQPTLEAHAPKVGSPWPAMPPPAAQRGMAQGERGPLVENVPRVMRVGAAVPVEVHIARDKIENLIMALSNGRGARVRPDSYVTRAVSVRLRAPQGGFSIEADSPETQWAESASSLPHDDHAVWRWTVVPTKAGRNRLLLTVATRTVGHDGVASESAPPERVIEVRIKSNKVRRLGKLIGWLIVLSAGAAIGYYGQDTLESVSLALRKLIGS